MRVKGVAELLDDLSAVLENLQPPLNNGLANQFARRLEAARQYFADASAGPLCSELADFKDAVTKAADKNNPKMTLQQAHLLNAAVDGVAAAAGC